MREWIDWYDSNHTIYVNARHRDVHFRRIARDIVSFIPTAGATVLDYGCGEALHADLVAVRAAKLILAEPAPRVRARLAARFCDHPNIEVRSLEEVAALPDHSVDVAVMHSVAQYMTSQEFDAALRTIRRLLRAEGLFVLGDIVAPHTSALADALALLRFALANGFLWAALGGLVRTLFSGYWRLRSAIGLARYDEAAIITKLARAGFSARRAATNIGHNPARMTFLCRRS